MVGTMNANRKHVPKMMKIGKNRALYSSVFLFSKATATTASVTLLSYSHKPNRVLIFISTQHQAVGNFEGGKKKTGNHHFLQLSQFAQGCYLGNKQYSMPKGNYRFIVTIVKNNNSNSSLSDSKSCSV